MRRILDISGTEQEVWLAQTADGHVLHIGERALTCELDPKGRKGNYVLTLEGAAVPLRLAVGDEATFIHLNGRTYEVGRVDPVDRLGDSSSSAAGDRLVAPMPGVVVSVSAAAGDAVTEGQPLLVIESMKLETTMVAPRDGIVAEIPFAPGDTFGLKDILAQLTPEEE